MAERDDQGRKHAPVAAWLLLAPGLLWLIWFFFVPLYTLGRMSLSSSPSRFAEPVFNWHWDNFDTAFSSFGEQFLHSFVYAVAATLLALVIAYPLAYFIAFRGGRWRNLLLLLVIAPFFVTYLIRTIAWQTILSDDGLVLDVLKTIGLVADDGRVLATSTAVIAGITYNYLPFMVLPIYVSLEQVDRRLLEAAGDLYASPRQGFLRVTLPISLPGVFAGTLLTFIPAVGDFINAELLGGPGQRMIGNVIQSKFLVSLDYPEAAALSFILMALILIIVVAYARAVGSERLTS